MGRWKVSIALEKGIRRPVGVGRRIFGAKGDGFVGNMDCGRRSFLWDGSFFGEKDGCGVLGDGVGEEFSGSGVAFGNRGDAGAGVLGGCGLWAVWGLPGDGPGFSGVKDGGGVWGQGQGRSFGGRAAGKAENGNEEVLSGGAEGLCTVFGIKGHRRRAMEAGVDLGRFKAHRDGGEGLHLRDKGAIGKRGAVLPGG